MLVVYVCVFPWCAVLFPQLRILARLDPAPVVAGTAESGTRSVSITGWRWDHVRDEFPPPPSAPVLTPPPALGLDCLALADGNALG